MFGLPSTIKPKQPPSPSSKHQFSRLDKVGIMVTSACASAAWRGYVISQLWNWFVHERFGVRDITMVHGMAFAVLSDVLLIVPSKPDEVVENMRIRPEEVAAAQATAEALEESFVMVALKTGLDAFGRPAIALGVGALLRFLLYLHR